MSRDDRRSEYAAKLLDPRWQKKRLQILERDGWACKNCDSTTRTLHVHHRKYDRGREPWEYHPDVLVTLCEDCHAFETSHRQLVEDSLRVACQGSLLANDVIALAMLVTPAAEGAVPWDDATPPEFRARIAVSICEVMERLTDRFGKWREALMAAIPEGPEPGS